MPMLTGTMNSEDLQRVYESDKERIFRFLNHKENELRRQLKKGFSTKCAKCYDYHTPNADYKLTLCTYSRRSIIDVYMYIKETNEYVVASARTNERDKACLVFTPHYIRRMGERIYGDRDMDVNKVLTYFILHSNTSINIYHKDRNYVYAMHGGISLALYDAKRDLMLLKTFVSIEMLKSTQKTAFERVASLVERYDDFMENEAARNGYAADELLLALSRECSTLDLDEVNNIYGQFFKKERLC